MKKLKLLAKFAATAAFLSIVLTGCPGLFPEDSNGTNNYGGGSNNTDPDGAIKGTLTVEDIWKGEDDEGEPITYYINSTFAIDAGGSLTIEDGAIVKFGPNGKINIARGGVIIANGTTFTSYRNPIGRTISINGGIEPAAGDWKNIYVNGGHAEFYGCEFSYGGHDLSTVYVYGSYATCKVDGCLFKFNAGSKSVTSVVDAALRYHENVPYSEDNEVINTTFENNVWPLSLSPKYSVSGTNHFGKGDKANEYNLIHLVDATVTGDVVWDHQEIPYLYAGTTNPLYIGYNSNNGNLTIKGGTADDPTVVEFYTKGLKVQKNIGVLYVENNTHFTNCEKTPTTKYPGLHCAKKIVWHDYYASGNVKQTHTETSPLLVSNTDKNIIIDGYQAGADYSTNTDWENRLTEISNENKYEEITLY